MDRPDHELKAVQVYPSVEALAADVAEHLCERATAAKGRKRPFSVALSGGSTPSHLYARLAADAGAKAALEEVHFFFGDERAVPPDHADSNYRLADEQLFRPLALERSHLHRFEAELPPELAARRYEGELETFFGDTGALDLVLLGLGPEGHTASLFPGSAAIEEKRRRAVAPFVEKLHSFRLTLTPPVFNAAAEVIFLVSGEEKADALARVLGAQRDPMQWPAQTIAPRSGALRWCADRPAASALTPEMKGPPSFRA